MDEDASDRAREDRVAIAAPFFPAPPKAGHSMALPTIVLDTNTIMALWVFQDPGLEHLRQWLDADPGNTTVATRPDALEELRHVLAYRQFALSTAQQHELLAAYARRARIIMSDPTTEPATAPLPRCRDADDQKFLEIARDSGASHLVSRDKALLRLARHRLVRERFSIQTPEALEAALASLARNSDR